MRFQGIVTAKEYQSLQEFLSRYTEYAVNGWDESCVTYRRSYV